VCDALQDRGKPLVFFAQLQSIRGECTLPRMEKKSLFEQQIAGYQITLWEDGNVHIHKEKSLIGKGSLDSVVLTQWNEAHLDGCSARLGKNPDETQLIYDQIDDALSLALAENDALRSQLCIPRNAKQLEIIAEDWSERLTPEEKKALDSEALQQKLSRAEYLSAEQAKLVLAHISKL
jgi:hypothetical protein